ncbi:MAG TPA: ABC transporter permease [Candidatus Atribacteria bacterium]|nr:ABC transporter permease [Candidatus Atribacteria bacterium]
MQLGDILHSTLLMSAPLIFAAMGGLFTYKVGLINIALEGLMTIGAFSSILFTFYTHSLIIGIVAGIIAGLLASILFALFVLGLKCNLIVSGLAINIAAISGTDYLLQVMFHTRGSFSPENITMLPKFSLGIFEKIPLIGPMLSNQGIMVYVSILFVFIVTYVINKTVFGIRIKATGENAIAAKSTGIDPKKIYLYTFIWSGVLSALGGIQLSLGYVGLFNQNITSGRGFMALAAIYFADGKPLLTTAACLLFGLLQALQYRLQIITKIPPQFPQILPYLGVVLVLWFISYRERKKNV